MSNISTVAIIGAGPSGIAAAKYLNAEGCFNIVIFEQRSNVGGLWNYSPCQKDTLKLPLSKEEDVTSPVYDRLETNIPRGLMGFSDLDWPSDSRLFPHHKTVLAYIEQYAEDVKHLVQFETTVTRVFRSPAGWQVETSKGQHKFDAVLVANGHFNIPHIPVVAGMAEWQQAYNSIGHSKFYRRPEDYTAKKVIIVGNSASGVDISAQIRQYCQRPLIQSSTSTSFLSPDLAGDNEKPEIVQFEVDNRTIHFADGTQESEIDEVLYCTGYLYSFPFLQLDRPVVTTGERTENLYKHIFYHPNPTLAFLVLNQKVIPFPVAEAQSAVIARVWAGRLSLPSTVDMQAWEQDRAEECQRLRDFHVLKFPKDGEYINELHDWAKQARGRDLGKPPPRWSDEDFWVREQFPAIKKAYQRLGEARHTRRTLKDVGFEYQPGVVSTV